MGVSIGSLVYVAVVLVALFAWLYFDRDSNGIA